MNRFGLFSILMSTSSMVMADPAMNCLLGDNASQKSSFTSTDHPRYYKDFDPHVDVTPTARGCPNKSGPYVVGAFLYWKTQLEKEDVVEKTTAEEGSNSLTLNIKPQEVHFKYAPGFKLGVGYNFKRDFWDIFANWTQLNSDKNHRFSNSTFTFGAASIEDSILYIPIPANGGVAFLGGSVDSKYKSHLSILDIELGRNLFIGRNVSMRPFVGVKADWIHWKFTNAYRNFFRSDTPELLGPSDFILKEHNQGVGPRMGLNSRWILSSWNFSLFANVAGSLMWTDMKGKKTVSQTSLETGETVNILTKAHRHEIKPVVEYIMGFDWGWCIRKSFYMNLSAGYEMQLWWDQTAADLNATVLNFNGEVHPVQALMLHGLTTALRFDF